VDWEEEDSLFIRRFKFEDTSFDYRKEKRLRVFACGVIIPINPIHFFGLKFCYVIVHPHPPSPTCI
jgi:hypothetical protein